MSRTVESEIIYDYLVRIGCCNSCSLRHLAEKRPAAYRDAEGSLKEKGLTVRNCEDGIKSKHKKVNPCTACLGLLQAPFSQAIIDKVLCGIDKLDYDSDTFNIALTIPVAFQLRAQSLWFALEGNYPNFVLSEFPQSVVTVSVKDAWKWRFVELIESKWGKKYDVSSPLVLSLSLKYSDELKECQSLTVMFPTVFYKNNIDNFSRKSAETALKQVTRKSFNSYEIPPAIPGVPAKFEELSANHTSINIAGRYLKLSRELPQTPWLIGGVRKMESSVEELISNPIVELAKAQNSKFSSSGREDVDVRTIGRGRPFNVELINPQKSKYNYSDMRAIEKKILLNADGKLSVRDLQIVPKESLQILKSGEEVKTKEYAALCIFLEQGFADRIRQLENLKEVILDQATPIRVLHRRPVAVRRKTIHWMKATPLPQDENKFILRLSTQAGTYIKEFIHGDFGRTKPSLGELLGGVKVDILTLDVEDISLDWPEPVDYGNGFNEN